MFDWINDFEVYQLAITWYKTMGLIVGSGAIYMLIDYLIDKRKKKK